MDGTAYFALALTYTRKICIKSAIHVLPELWCIPPRGCIWPP